MSTTPASGATGVSATAPNITASFNQAVQSGTIALTIQGPGNTSVPGSVSYNAATDTATWAPTSALAASTTYTATVSGAENAAGTAMASPYSWSFTTAAATTITTDTIFSSPATPATASYNGGGAVEVGVKFESSEAGYIDGVSFYKGTSNTGTHVGYLWSSTGTLLASATFTNETASGWQQVNFATPVAIAANTVYVASYLSPTGYFAYNNNYFASAVTNGPLTAPASSTVGGNGVYLYGTSRRVPDRLSPGEQLLGRRRVLPVRVGRQPGAGQWQH